MTICAVLIVRDEEQCLGACLASLKGVVDETVVVDTGSVDATTQLAVSCGAKLFEFAWCDDFSEARNFANGCTECDYILSIDADNCIVNQEDARALLDSFVQHHGNHVVGTIEITSQIGTGQEALESIEKAPRFFRRGTHHYVGVIHEQLVPDNAETSLSSTGVRYDHSGYAHAIDSPQHKSRRNTPLLLSALERQPADEYLWFQLGKAYMAEEKHAAAVDAFEGSMDSIDFQTQPPTAGGGAVSDGVLTDLVCSLAYSYVNSERIQDARELLDRHLAIGHPGVNSADFHHVSGYVYLMLGDVEKSRAAYHRSLELGSSHEQVLGTGSFSSHYHLGLLCEAEQKLDGACVCYLVALEQKHNYFPAISRCVDMIVEYSVMLPAELWDVADHEMLCRTFCDAVERSMVGGNGSAARLLMKSAAHLSQELFTRCRERVESLS